MLCYLSLLSKLIFLINLFKIDKRSGKPKIWMYNDKTTGLPKGEATVTYDDSNAARSAIKWFDSKCHSFELFIK